MLMGRRSDHSRTELEELIVAAGHRLMEETGFSGFSAREVARRIGYSIGIGYPPDWGEHTISLRPGDRTILTTGNVLHSILGMWMDGWGIEVSETILVTANGCETLTKFPREIHVKY